MGKETYVTEIDSEQAQTGNNYYFLSTDGYEDWAGDKNFEEVRKLYQDADTDYTVTEYIFETNTLFTDYQQVEEMDNFVDSDFY
jgi:hypothetical protein